MRRTSVRLAAILLTAITLGVAGTATPAAAAGVRVDANGGTAVNLRTGPGTTYALAGSVANGATVNIVCYSYGTAHTGRWGASEFWNKLDNGKWISDAFVYTGSATPIVPPCVQLGLPFAVGETWKLSSGPHSWNGDGRPKPWGGLDFAGGSGQVRAAAAGTAYLHCGNFVRIDHGQGWQTSYYHLTGIAVTNGQQVAKGQYLGTISSQIGCGGGSDGPHQHFNLWRNVGTFDFAEWKQINAHGIVLGGWRVEQAAINYQGCLVRLSDGNRQCAGNGLVRH